MENFLTNNNCYVGFTYSQISHLTDSTGKLKSVNFPNSNYDNHVAQQWHIITDPGNVITLKFTDFETQSLDENEAKTDWLRVSKYLCHLHGHKRKFIWKLICMSSSNLFSCLL